MSIGPTWIAAQELRLIYHSPDRGRAEQALYWWLTYCADADIPELTRLARTIDSWHAELLAYFDTAKVSSGPTEAMNLLIKKIKRVGHGFRNFANYRLRLLLHCGVGRDTVRPPRSEVGYHAQWRRARFAHHTFRNRGGAQKT